MTDDEKRELIAEARDTGTFEAGEGTDLDAAHYWCGLAKSLADALEGTLNESEWEEKVEYGQMTSLGFFPEIRGRNYATHQRTVRWSEPAPVWEVVTDDRD